jgi:hypothetical protein
VKRAAFAASFVLAGLLAATAELAADGAPPPEGAPARQQDGGPKRANPGVPPDKADAPGDSQRGDGMRRGGGMAMSAEMFEQVIAVAKDVSPEMGEKLEQLRDLPPEEKVQAMRQNARRLVTLVVLKKRNPELYDTRVKELRVQLELHGLGEKFMTAEAKKDSSAMATLGAEIEKKVKIQVELDLKARAQELRAMDQQLVDLKKELEVEVKERAGRVAERVEAIKKGQPIKGRGYPGDGEGRGPRDAEGRPRDGDGRPRDGEGRPPREDAKPGSGAP